jgi:2-keto-4-pentenoate hydratase/2-oxohepta-3-ene-1,7-dioic acid hydratase in catechol pathway
MVRPVDFKSAPIDPDFSLRDGDLVEIEIEGIGVLRNRISVLSS